MVLISKNYNSQYEELNLLSCCVRTQKIKFKSFNLAKGKFTKQYVVQHKTTIFVVFNIGLRF